MIEITPDASNALLAFAIALAVSGALAFPILKGLIRIKSRQTVSEHVAEHAAKQGTPTMGGLILLVGFFAGCAAAYPALWTATARVGNSPYLVLPLMALAFAVVGFVDDYVVPQKMKGKRGLGWTQKLGLQVAIAAPAMWFMAPSPSPVAVAVGVFLILFFSNAYNFSDGMDALAGSLLLIMAVGFAGLAILARTEGALLFLGALAGGCVPFLFLNRPPAKVFMGDVGSLPVGAVLGALVAAMAMPELAPGLGTFRVDGQTGAVLGSDQLFASAPVLVGLAVISFVMVAELVPVPMQIFWVKVFKKRLFPMTPIHHAFQKAGWPETRVVALFLSVQVLCTGLGYLGAVLIDRSMTPAPVVPLESPPS